MMIFFGSPRLTDHSEADDAITSLYLFLVMEV